MSTEGEKAPPCIATHSGTFHADDVFAVATLLLYIGDTEVDVVRTRDSDVYEECDYVVDVGGEYDPTERRFDHHQIGGAGARENGVPYAAFGLVWKEYGASVAGSEEAAQAIDEKMIQTIDALDNGVDISLEHDEVNFYLIHNLIFAARPTWKEEGRSNDSAFFEVLPMAKYILEREIVHAQHRREGQEYVREVYEETEDKRIIVLEGNQPWHEVLTEMPEPLFVVQPHDDDNGNWKVRTVRTSLSTFENRKDLPSEWAGKRDEELARVTGVEDSVFCHNKCFIAVAHSKEGALELARLALEA